jgi:hypothetical protein
LYDVVALSQMKIIERETRVEIKTGLKVRIKI